MLKNTHSVQNEADREERRHKEPAGHAEQQEAVASPPSLPAAPLAAPGRRSVGEPRQQRRARPPRLLSEEVHLPTKGT